IENLGDKPVFVQAGDIVKGGKQDRTLTVSLLLPPKSGAIPIASFCVEHGRWSPRAAENAAKFNSSASAVPSRETKLAMHEPPAPAAPGGPALYLLDESARIASHADISERQQKVWDSVAKTQRSLSSSLGDDVRAKLSASSLQLALENEKLGMARDKYVK